jgi:ADP-ribosylglycohydrolase
MYPTSCLLGAAAGDIIGSRFEGWPHKSESFELFAPSSRFTDDTVLTVAVADAILRQEDYGPVILAYARRYPHAGYGGSFRKWMYSPDPQPYDSFGNGSAMRVSPVGWAFDTVEEVLREAEHSAIPTHNHSEGIKGAQAVALQKPPVR